MDLTHRDTPSDSDSDTEAPLASRVAAWVLFSCTAGVAVVTFVLSFHGLDDYGHQVAGLGGLSWMVPLGVDGLTITAIAATFLLARAPFRVRLYAWLVFFVANVASVAGNLSHARARHLSLDGSAGAAAWPVLLTLASHLAIVTRRALVRQAKAGAARQVERQPDTSSAPETRPIEPAATAPGDATPPVAERQVPHVRPSTPRPQRRPKTGDPRTVAQAMWRDGKSHAEIAMALGVSKKTAERHTEPLRQTAAASDSDDKERVG